jgi:uncharacterized protein
VNGHMGAFKLDAGEEALEMMPADYMRELRIFKYDQDSFVVFHPSSRVLFSANARSARILEACARGEPPEVIARSQQLDARLVGQLVSGASAAIDKKLKQNASAPTTDKICRKLVLHVSNRCNMRCTYCYGDSGTYGMSDRLMTPEIAMVAIDRFCQYYDRLGNVMFFGGEPLLNFPVIRMVCEYVEGRKVRFPTWLPPSLSMVTNLSLIPKGFPDLIRDHHIRITVSLDGPQYVNDLQRIFKSGKGTFLTVSRNIERLKAETGQPEAVEVTLTNGHATQRIGHDELIEYFEKTFGIREVEMCAAVVPPNSPNHVPPTYMTNFLEDEDTACAKFTGSLATSKEVACPNSFGSTLQLVAQGGVTFDYHCIAGIERYAVAANGDIYPCQMFVGNERFCMGNVRDPNVFRERRFVEVKQMFEAVGKSRLESCSKCWVRSICLGCPGKSFRTNGTLAASSIVNCDQVAKLTENQLAQLAKLNSSSVAWANLRNALAAKSQTVEKPQSQRESVA